MKPRIAEQWVAALRSGDYEQGTHCLRDKENRFCCLGVLSEMYRKEHPEAHWVEREENNRTIMFNDGEEVATGVLTYKVMDWAGINSVGGEIVDTHRTLYLTEVNDDGTPFGDIAKLIEEQQELL